MPNSSSQSDVRFPLAQFLAWRPALIPVTMMLVAWGGHVIVLMLLP